MKLSTQEKAAIATVLHLIQEHPAINNSAIDIPLNYIPKPTHTLIDIIEASELYDTLNFNDPKVIANPLYSAIMKSQIFIVSKDKLNFDKSNILAISLAKYSYDTSKYGLHLFIVIDLDVLGV